MSGSGKQARRSSPGVEAEHKPETVREWLEHWATGARLEAVFTVLTLAFMISGWATAKLGVAWHDIFYLGAYLTGGYFGVRAGLQSLRQWTIDVDLLMVLAALGAAVVNARSKERCCSSFSRFPMCCRPTRSTARAKRSSRS